MQRLQQRLTTTDEEFKAYHLGIVDLLELEEGLENEQVTLDDHDNRVASLFDHMHVLLSCLITTEELEVKTKADPC